MSLLSGSVREAGDARPMDVFLLDASGNPVTSLAGPRPANAEIDVLTFTAATQVIAAADPARRKLIVYNATNKTLYLSYAATSSLTEFSVPVAVNTAYEISGDDYAGIISGILAGAPSGVNKVYVTKVTE